MGQQKTTIETPPETRLAQSADARAFGRIAARAFFNDPLFTYALPDESSRLTAAAWVLERNIRYGLTYGVVLAIGNDAFAAWLPPAHSTMRFRPTARLFAAAPIKIGLSATLRFNRFGSIQNRLHNDIMHGRDHWYLLLLAVDPEKQGKGFGKRIIEPALRQADRDSVSCYLETVSQDNIAFFEKQGFSVRGEAEVLYGPRVWGMMRER